MSEVARKWISVAEYFAWEEGAATRSEYFDGEIFAMAGGTPEHNLISSNTLRELGNQLEERPCRVYPSDQRITVAETGLYTYPDVTVVCDEPHFEEPGRRALTNPTVIVEVLSESTEAYDRGDKFAHYRRLSSLKEYVLVSSDQHRIERFTRREVGADWLMTECSDPEGVIELPSIGCVLSLPRVYRKVELQPRQSGRRRGPG